MGMGCIAREKWNISWIVRLIDNCEVVSRNAQIFAKIRSLFLGNICVYKQKELGYSKRTAIQKRTDILVL